MMRAIALGDGAQVEHFLKKGISPNARQYGRSVYELAIEGAFITGDLSVMHLLFEAGALLPKSACTSVYLSTAIHLKRYDIAELMVEHGANHLESDSPHGGSAGPLQSLYFQERLDVIENFARKAPDINLADAVGVTFLHHATMKGHYELARILIARGADLDVANAVNGETPIYMAVARGDDEVLQMLIEAGASLNVVNHAGKTPLDEAITYGFASTAIIIWTQLGLTEVDEYRGATLMRHFKNKWSEKLVAQWYAGRQAAKDLIDAFGTESLALAQSQGNQTRQRGKGLAL